MPVVTSRSRVSQGLEGKRAFKLTITARSGMMKNRITKPFIRQWLQSPEILVMALFFFRWKAPCFPSWIACKTDPDFQNQDGFKWRWKCCREYLDLPGNMRINGKLRFKSSGPGQEKLTTLTEDAGRGSLVVMVGDRSRLRVGQYVVNSPKWSSL